MGRILTIILLASCAGGNGGPRIEPMDPITAVVGVELSVEIRASDPEGERLSFDFDSPDIDRIQQRARIAQHASGLATFRFLPVASDLGVKHIDFFASDGTTTDIESVIIRIAEASAKDGTPVFVAPAGAGTTLDLLSAKCLNFTVEVVDTDSEEVVIGVQTTGVQATYSVSVERTGPQSARVTFCPNALGSYGLILVADDYVNPTVSKRFSVLVQEGNYVPPDTTPVIAPTGNACENLCGDASEVMVGDMACHCDDDCSGFQDCCPNICTVCGTHDECTGGGTPAGNACENLCGDASEILVGGVPCHCDDECSGFQDCCPDICAVCGSHDEC